MWKDQNARSDAKCLWTDFAFFILWRWRWWRRWWRWRRWQHFFFFFSHEICDELLLALQLLSQVLHHLHVHISRPKSCLRMTHGQKGVLPLDPHCISACLAAGHDIWRGYDLALFGSTALCTSGAAVSNAMRRCLYLFWTSFSFRPSLICYDLGRSCFQC